MPEQRRPTLAIGAALDWELRAVLQALGTTRKARHGETRVWRGAAGEHTVLLYRTGVGVDLAARRTDSLLAAGGIDVVINTGCAGGLRDDLNAGSVVAAAATLGPLPAVTRHPCSPQWTARLHAAAHAAGLSTHGGALLTSPVPLLTAASKRQHRDVHGATAVDMESAAVAAVAAARGIAAAALRAVFDTAEVDIPPAALLVPPRARQRVTHVVRLAVADPQIPATLLRLRRSQHAAQTALERTFRCFLRALASGDSDGD